MPRKPKTIPGPSRLSKILANLKKGPHPQLSAVTGLKLTLAFQNDHFGARHFVKEDLPRIRYANPDLNIKVTKLRKTPEERWDPEMQVELRDGTIRTVNMQGKWSSAIFEELMEMGGGDAWQKWKEDRIAAGLPIVDLPVAATKPKTQTAPTPLIHPGKTGAAAVLP